MGECLLLKMHRNSQNAFHFRKNIKLYVIKCVQLTKTFQANIIHCSQVLFSSYFKIISNNKKTENKVKYCMIIICCSILGYISWKETLFTKKKNSTILQDERKRRWDVNYIYFDGFIHIIKVIQWQHFVLMTKRKEIINSYTKSHMMNLIP